MEETLSHAEQKVDNGRRQIALQMTIGAWIITFLLLSIPLVNIVLIFVWAFDAKSERRNFSRAYLIIVGIVFVLSILAGIVIFALSATSGLFDFS